MFNFIIGIVNFVRNLKFRMYRNISMGARVNFAVIKKIKLSANDAYDLVSYANCDSLLE